jgi:PAS domain S-box-containing protein
MKTVEGIAQTLEGSRRKAFALAFSTFAFVAVVDLLTPEQFSFSLFYLFPIALFLWFVDNGWGWACAGASALLWAANHLAHGDRGYFQTLVPYWEAASRFGFYSAFIISLATIKRYLGRLRSMNDELSSALTVQRESEQRYREVFEHSSSGILLLDVTPDGRFRIVTANPAVQQMTGISVDEGSGRFIDEVLPPAAAEELTANYRRCISAGVPITVGGSVDLPAGHVTFRTTLIPIRDASGRIHRLIALPVDLTASSQAEEARREIEQRYREVFENTSDGIFVIDVTAERRFRVVAFNPAMERMVGLTNDEVAGKYNEEFLPAESAAAVTANNERCLRTGEPISFEEQIDLRRGRFTWNTTLVPVRNAGGRVYRILGVTRDITENARIQRALRQSEEKFSRAFHASPDCITISGIDDGVLLEVNRGFTELSGYSREEAIGRSARPGDLGVWVDADQRLRLAALLRRDREVTGFEATLQRRTGEPRHTVLSSGIVEIEGAEYMLAIARDVTDRRRIEAALGESESRYREIFENTSDGIFVIEVVPGPRYRLLGINPAQEKMFEISAEETVGRFNDEFLPGEVAEKVNDNNRRCIEAGHPMSFEDVFDLRGGRTYFTTTLVPVRDDAGRVVRIIGVARDFTEKVRAEEREKEHERQLFQAAKLSSLGTLVAGIAHEINNPNNFIRLNSQNLQEIWKDIRCILDEDAAREEGLAIHGIPYETVRGMVEDLMGGIGEGSKRIEKLLVNLRDFARGDEGELTENVDVNAVIDSAVMITRELIQKSTTAFTVVKSPDLPLVRGNYHQIEQVVINLLANACQALPSRDRKITVMTSLQGDSDSILLEVADEGVGMPPQYVSRVTDPFFTTKRAKGGSGLGLAVSSRIVSNHKGSIAFDSKLEIGTRVTVRLPAGGKTITFG